MSITPGADYQWYSAIADTSFTNMDFSNFRSTKTEVLPGIYTYYAQVLKNSCIVNSDTIAVEYAAVIVPSIIADAGYVCTGVNPVIKTTDCPGCTFSWLLDTLPVLGALNDTFHTVTSLNANGIYQVAVEYNNGCKDTSAGLQISDGSFTLTLGNAPGADQVICNGQGEDLEVNFAGGSGAVGNPL